LIKGEREKVELRNVIAKDRDAIISSLVNLVRFRSLKASSDGPGAPFGRGIADALEHTLALAKSMGFQTRNVDGYAGHAEYGAGKDIVAVLVHLDVVPAGGEWTFAPFDGVISDGKIYGRGTEDNKGPAIASLYALKALKDTGIKLSKRIRIIFGCDEESGWDCMKHYLAAEELPSCGFAPDAMFPIIGSEKGIAHFDLSRKFGPPQGGGVWVKELRSGDRTNVIPATAVATVVVLPEKRAAVAEVARRFAQGKEKINVDVVEHGLDTLEITLHGVAGHASLPHLAVNALTHMIVLLSSLDLAPGASSDFIRFFAENVGYDYHGTLMGVGLADEVSGKLTLNLGVMDLNEKGATAQIDIRYPVTCKFESVRGPIAERAAAAGLALDRADDKEPLYVPSDHELIQKLAKVYNAETGLKPEVISIGGGTYARAIPNAVAFGPVFPGQVELAHQKDEYMTIEDLMMLTRIYAHAMAELAV
jgi:succinyl-diaminopimelate desuccinylase